MDELARSLGFTFTDMEAPSEQAYSRRPDGEIDEDAIDIEKLRRSLEDTLSLVELAEDPAVANSSVVIVDSKLQATKAMTTMTTTTTVPLSEKQLKPNRFFIICIRLFFIFEIFILSLHAKYHLRGSKFAKYCHPTHSQLSTQNLFKFQEKSEHLLVCHSMQKYTIQEVRLRRLLLSELPQCATSPTQPLGDQLSTMLKCFHSTDKTRF